MLNSNFKRKIVVFVITSLFSYQAYSQENISFLSNTKITGGVYLHEIIPLVGILGQGNRYLYASPEIGIHHRFNNSPLSISYRRAWNYVSDANNEIYFAQRESGSDYDEIDLFFLNYHLEKPKINYRFGIGYFHKRWIVPAYFISRGIGLEGIFEYRGLVLATAFELQNLNIEFKKHIELPDISFFEAHLYTISLNKYFSLQKKELVKQTHQSNNFFDNFHLYVSMRLQAIKYYHTQNADLFNFFGFVPGIGLSYFDPKNQLEFVICRNSWKRYIGGTYDNDLIGYISTSGIVVKKHFMLKHPQRKLIVGLGWYPISNDNEPERIKMRTLIDPESGTEFLWPRRKQLNVFGVGATVAYQLNRNYSIEYRHIFPYLGDTAFSPWYGSLGVSYRLF